MPGNSLMIFHMQFRNLHKTLQRWTLFFYLVLKKLKPEEVKSLALNIELVLV
jgi:hypothetical protein